MMPNLDVTFLDFFVQVEHLLEGKKECTIEVKLSLFILKDTYVKERQEITDYSQIIMSCHNSVKSVKRGKRKLRKGSNYHTTHLPSTIIFMYNLIRAFVFLLTVIGDKG
jgi:hypothetical protein